MRGGSRNAAHLGIGQMGKTVLLDYWFNNEWKKDATGTQARFHYTWDDKTYGGFAMLGDIFRIHGMKTASLETAPTATKPERRFHLYYC